jgi:hypothetical protein
MRTTFVKGALVGAITASVVMVSAAAWAGTGVGGVFNLGKTNSVNGSTLLIGKTTDKQLKITNTGSGPALGLSVAAGKAPLTVNSSAGKATNLNADKLDGLDSTAFEPHAHRIYANITSATAGEQSAGSAGPWTFGFTCAPGGPATFTVHGPGTSGGRTTIAAPSVKADTYLDAPGSIGGGVGGAVAGGNMTQDLFLQNGTTAMEVHVLFNDVPGGLFDVCTLIGDAIQIS